MLNDEMEAALERVKMTEEQLIEVQAQRDVAQEKAKAASVFGDKNQKLCEEVESITNNLEDANCKVIGYKASFYRRKIFLKKKQTTKEMH